MKSFVIGHYNVFYDELKLIFKQGTDKLTVLLAYMETKHMFEGCAEDDDTPKSLKEAYIWARDQDQVLHIKELPIL
jgi:hypothetical protein